jgi:hypothetical protein
MPEENAGVSGYNAKGCAAGPVGPKKYPRHIEFERLTVLEENALKISRRFRRTSNKNVI